MSLPPGDTPELPPEAPVPTGRDRLKHSLLRPSRGQAVVAVLLAVLAFAAVTQVRTSRANDPYAAMRQADLVQALSGLSAASARAQSDIATLQRTRDSLLSTTQRRSAAIAQARKEVTALGILAGTIPATGPGVEILVSDHRHRLSINHLLDGIEELRDAGAEAMQLNGTVRIVAQTSFEDATGGILVDGKPITAPYTIIAIGDPATLAKAVNFPGGFTDEVKIDQATLTVQRLRVAHVEATVAPAAPTYAKPHSGS